MTNPPPTKLERITQNSSVQAVSNDAQPVEITDVAQTHDMNGQVMQSLNSKA